jgi:hypothetical protein
VKLWVVAIKSRECGKIDKNEHKNDEIDRFYAIFG